MHAVSTSKTIYREPQVEEGKHNVLLQNRCGNRLTLLVHDDHTDLEWVYKPNGFRRKDYRARNFSSRDVQTTLFRASALPEIGAEIIEKFDYDPFVTRLEILAPSTARNLITVVNMADENCFAIAADRPLALTFTPHEAFEVRDGRLIEKFSDRGEEIVSFVFFKSFEDNRFRFLDDGRAVVQIYENELVFVGGEENETQIARLERKLRPLSLEKLIQRNETLLRATLKKGTLSVANDDFQRVVDLNRRVVFSGLDAGGACFGALNRIYYLIWNRDGSMTTAMAARAGNPDFLRVWAPFILANPAWRRDANGERVPEWLQILGSRWTKSEDDGIYYAALSLYTLFQTTGEADFLDSPEWKTLLQSLDYNIATRFSEEEALFGSDTRGETTLAGSPYFGYDTVNGTMPRELHPVENEGLEFRRVFSLYHNVNLFNTLTMIAALLAESDTPAPEKSRFYTELSVRLQTSLQTKFVNEDGVFHADYVYFADGSRGWIEFEKADYWEYTWAVSVGPFFPDLPTALKSARMVIEEWPKIRHYGYCPWNTLARFLREYGMSNADFTDMLREEVHDALVDSVKFPLRGALTEYQKDIESWRGLPFSAGSFLFSLAGSLLQSLPAGLAVRAGGLVTQISDFRFRNARIAVDSRGDGDGVTSWTLNGREVKHALQIPENLLRNGQNYIAIERGEFAGFRLYSSSATLREVEKIEGGSVFHFTSPVACELVFENFERAKSVTVENHSSALDVPIQSLPATSLSVLPVPASGDFRVTVLL